MMKYGLEVLLNSLKKMNSYLSILKNASNNSITYYVGENVKDLEHLKNCTVFCKKKFNIDKSVKQIIVKNPQLEFYKLSSKQNIKYSFIKDKIKKESYGSNLNIQPTTKIGNDVVIGNNVTIGHNTVIYSKTIIGDNVRIDDNCIIGAEGIMWVWDNDKKVYLKQLGGVKIEDNVIICSGCIIVRGSANELTIISEGACLAPNCAIGHGTFIGKNTHLANNISTGGSTYISEKNFLGSGSIISAGIKLLSQNIILGAGTVASKNLIKEGVYVGIPAKRIKSAKEKMSGIPNWKR